MAWLSGYSYRLLCEVDNRTTAGDRYVANVPLNAFILAELGLCESDYSDVHLALEDGTELACALNAAKDAVSFDFDDCPVGVSKVYAYLGNASASAPSAPAGTASTAINTQEFMGLEALAGGDVAFFLSGGNLDSTYLDSGASTTGYGANSTFLSGVTSASRKYHGLLRHFEGALPKGTPSYVKAHLKLSSLTVAENMTLQIHRLRNYGTHTYWPYSNVAAGWAVNTRANLPTWDTRMADYQAAWNGTTTRAWQTGGATGANEITGSDYATLALTPTDVAGYFTVDLPLAWAQGWVAMEYSIGVLLKDSTDSATANRYVEVDKAGTVLEFGFSAIADNQARKVSQDTYCYATQPTQDRNWITHGTDHFSSFIWLNSENRIDGAYISPSGRIRRVLKNEGPVADLGAELYNGSLWGMTYDESEGRYWTASSYGASYQLAVAYSEPHDLSSFTWKTRPISTVKSVAVPVNGVCRVPVFDNANGGIVYYEYTRSTDTWSASTRLVNGTLSGSTPHFDVTIDSGTAMTGDADDIISFSDEINGYLPSKGVIAHAGTGGTEYFGYAGLDDANNHVTHVVRAVGGTTARQHTVGGLAFQNVFYLYRGETNYITFLHDELNGCFYVIYLWVWTSAPMFYSNICVMKHYYADAAGDWYRTGAKTEGNKHTLPLTQLTEEFVTTDPPPEYYDGGIVLDNGDVLICRQGHDPATNTYKQTSVRRLPNGSQTWGSCDITDCVQGSFVDMGDGNVVMTGLNTTLDATVVYYSSDHGQTWTEPDIVSEYSFAAGITNATDMLWESSVSALPGPGGKGFVYATHDAHFGGVFYDEVGLVPPVYGYPDYAASASFDAAPTQGYTASLDLSSVASFDVTTEQGHQSVAAFDAEASFSVTAIQGYSGVIELGLVVGFAVTAEQGAAPSETAAAVWDAAAGFSVAALQSYSVAVGFGAVVRFDAAGLPAERYLTPLRGDATITYSPDGSMTISFIPDGVTTVSN